MKYITLNIICGYQLRCWGNCYFLSIYTYLGDGMDFTIPITIAIKTAGACLKKCDVLSIHWRDSCWKCMYPYIEIPFTFHLNGKNSLKPSVGYRNYVNNWQTERFFDGQNVTMEILYRIKWHIVSCIADNMICINIHWDPSELKKSIWVAPLSQFNYMVFAHNWVLLGIVGLLI